MSSLLNASRQIAVREEWLALHEEEALEPALPIIDPHHHLWDRADERYMMDDLLRDIRSGHDVRATVFIQCASMYRASGPEDEKPLGETEFVNGVAAMSASGGYGAARLCAGIVGMVDLTLGDRVRPLLEAHMAIAGPRFRGVRNRTAWHPSPEVRSNLTSAPPGPLEDPRFVEGARALARLGLTLDVWAYHTQLPLVLALARSVPELTIVLNHVGGPLGTGPYTGKRAEVFPVWRESLRALATCPNIVAKIGGLGMEIGGLDHYLAPRPPSSETLAAAYRPHVEATIEAFGADRCMFESNFPVDKGMSSYAVLWNTFKRIAAQASATEKTALFAATAARIYRIDPALITPSG
jgi:predicted TIM-barrel fold metal-dependent hydrolase